MFSTIFIFLVLQQYNVLFVYLIISFITFSQRIVYNHHTFLQILVGAIVGSLFGYIMYHLATEKIKGNIKEKPDDFGPI
jgi:multisubunit Na+/H+ antiporter MnhE subunit